jgi:hypothetical protein
MATDTAHALDILSTVVLSQSPAVVDLELTAQMWDRLDAAGVVTTPRDAFERGVLAGACATFVHLIDDEGQLLNVMRRVFERRR